MHAALLGVYLSSGALFSCEGVCLLVCLLLVPNLVYTLCINSPHTMTRKRKCDRLFTAAIRLSATGYHRQLFQHAGLMIFVEAGILACGDGVWGWDIFD